MKYVFYVGLQPVLSSDGETPELDDDDDVGKWFIFK